MLSSNEYCRQSLGLHLFFARIMKEHAFFMQASFTPKNANLSQQADNMKIQIEALLERTVTLANGVVDKDILLSGEVITIYTSSAENATQNLTGIRLANKITQQEKSLVAGDNFVSNPMLDQRVDMLNKRAITLVSDLIRFKKMILTEVLSCRIYTTLYPLLLEHIIGEGEFYLDMIKRLQNHEDINSDKLALKNEIFWNHIMAEHSAFIRGLLDPTEEELIMAANGFVNEFNELTKEAKEAMSRTMQDRKVTQESLKATEQIRGFKVSGAQGIIGCKIKSIITPLLADHVLREANHYLRLLKTYENEEPYNIILP